MFHSKIHVLAPGDGGGIPRRMIIIDRRITEVAPGSTVSLRVLCLLSLFGERWITGNASSQLPKR